MTPLCCPAQLVCIAIRLKFPEVALTGSSEIELMYFFRGPPLFALRKHLLEAYLRACIPRHAKAAAAKRAKSPAAGSESGAIYSCDNYYFNIAKTFSRDLDGYYQCK